MSLKKSKPNEVIFDDMPDDCFFAIWKFLKWNEILNTLLICKRYYEFFMSFESPGCTRNIVFIPRFPISKNFRYVRQILVDRYISVENLVMKNGEQSFPNLKEIHYKCRDCPRKLPFDRIFHTSLGTRTDLGPTDNEGDFVLCCEHTGDEYVPCCDL